MNMLDSKAQQGVMELTVRVADYARNRRQPLRIGVIEDEELYFEAIKVLIDSCDALSPWMEIRQWYGKTGQLLRGEGTLPDLIICDIDLGRDHDDGFTIVEKLRKAGLAMPVLMHSNRSGQCETLRAQAVGAQALIAKPMTQQNLLGFVWDHTSLFEEKRLKRV